MANTKNLPKYDAQGRRLQSFGHGDVELITSDDSSNKIIDMIVRTIRRKGGKQAAFPETEKGFEDFKNATVAYLEEVKEYNTDDSHEQKMLVDIESWCVSIGISRATLSTYYRTRSETWKNFIDLVKNGIVAVKKHYASFGKMPPVLFIFDSINNFGYTDVKNITIDTNNAATTAELSPEQIAQQIDADIPMDMIEASDALPTADIFDLESKRKEVLQ